VTAERLRKEWDESRQNEERLRTEHDAAQQQVGSLEAKLKRENAQKLDAENASAGLAADLSREKVKVLTLYRELDEARKDH
jgi:chromosome segregation ATPase